MMKSNRIQMLFIEGKEKPQYTWMRRLATWVHWTL